MYVLHSHISSYLIIIYLLKTSPLYQILLRPATARWERHKRPHRRSSPHGLCLRPQERGCGLKHDHRQNRRLYQDLAWAISNCFCIYATGQWRGWSHQVVVAAFGVERRCQVCGVGGADCHHGTGEDSQGIFLMNSTITEKLVNKSIQLVFLGIISRK